MNLLQLWHEHHQRYGTGPVVGLRDVQQLLRDAERLSLPAEIGTLKRNLDSALGYFRAVASEGLQRNFVESTYACMYVGLLAELESRGWHVRVEQGLHTIQEKPLEELCGMA